MAKFNPGSLISEIRGSVGDDTYSKNAFGPYVKQKLTQTVRNTSFQILIRDAITDANIEYKNLTDDDFKTWTEFVRQHPESNRLSQRINISAYNEFCRRYVNRALMGSSSTGFSAEPACDQFSTMTNVVASVGMLTGTIKTQNYNGTATVAVYATPPLSPTIRSINPSLYNFIGTVNISSDSEDVDLTQLYLDRYQIFGDGLVKRIGIVVKNIRYDNFASGSKFTMNTVTDGTFPLVPPAGYQAILTYATSQGFTLPSIKVQYNQALLYQALLNIGFIQNCDIFYCMFADNVPDFTRINWASPGNFTLTAVGTPTFTALSGWNGNGSSYFTTGYNAFTAGVNFTANNASIFAYIETAVTPGGCDIGSANGTTSLSFIQGYFQTGLSSARTNCNSTGSNTISSSWSAGLNMSSRLNSTQRRMRHNGALVATSTLGAGAIPNFTTYVLAQNTTGSATLISSNTISFAGMSNNQDANAALLYFAMLNYRLSIL